MAPFHDWPSLVRFLRFNMRRDGDNVVAVCGSEGSGKSTLVAWLHHDLIGAVNTPRFSEDAVFDFDDLPARWDTGRRGQVVAVDEGANLFFNRDHATQQSKAIVRMLMQARAMNSTLLIACPRYDSLDLYLREHRCKIRVLIPDHFTADGQVRGSGVVQWRCSNLDGSKVWWETAFEVHWPKFHDNDEWERYVAVKRAKFDLHAHDAKAVMVKAKG